MSTVEDAALRAPYPGAQEYRGLWRAVIIKEVLRPVSMAEHLGTYSSYDEAFQVADAALRARQSAAGEG